MAWGPNKSVYDIVKYQMRVIAPNRVTRAM